MKRATVIVGLPGSGKTYFARKFQNALLVDDASLYPEDLNRALNSSAEHVVITDPMACFSTREKIQYRVGNRELIIICFENDPDACWNNILNRSEAEKRISRRWLDRFSARYNIEDLLPDQIRSVYKTISAVEMRDMLLARLKGE